MPRLPAHPVRFRTAVAVGLLSLVCFGASAKFQSSDGSFTLTYPDGWSVVKPPPEPMMMLLVKGAPPRGRPAEGTPMIFATREKVTGKPTLDQLEEKTLAAFKEAHPDAQIVSSDAAKLGGEPARRITMKGRGRLGEAEVVDVMVVSLHGDATYSLGCSSTDEDTERHAADLDKIVASFRFGNVRGKDGASEKEKKPPEDNKLPFAAVKLPKRDVVLNGKVKGAPCSFLAIATIRGGKAYSVGCICDPESLPKLRADVQSIADSFQWTDAAPPAKPAPAPRRKAPGQP